MVGRPGEHVGGKTGGSCDDKFGEGGDKVIGGPDGGVGVKQVVRWKV